MSRLKYWIGSVFAIAAAIVFSTVSQADDMGSEENQSFTFRLHHFLPTSSTTHTGLLVPWAETIERQSQGRLKIEIYPAMQLGGRAPQLFDQVKDGVVDMAWTLPGYTAGRFPITEVFELPFMSNQSARTTSLAIEEFGRLYLMQEYADVQPLLFHAHGSGSLHVRESQIAALKDFQGKRLRAPTRQGTRMIEALGGISVGMPAPQVPEALSRGVIDGAAFPFEVTKALRLNEMVDSHTLIEGERGLYTAVFLLAMNKDSYNSLPDDLKALLDRNSGKVMAQLAGHAWDQAEEESRQQAELLGNHFATVSDSQIGLWKEQTKSVIEGWITEMDRSGYDGAMLYNEANRLLDKHSSLQDVAVQE